MNFKKFGLLLITIAFSLSGCSDFINGKRKKDEEIKAKNDRFACIGEIPNILRNLLSEESEPQQLQEAIICAETSLAYFKKRTVGTTPDGYLVSDIRSFFGNYLGDHDRVSDEMSRQMMKIKKALFGGSDQILTKSELQSLIDLLPVVREEIQKLKPFWALVVLKNNQSPRRELILQANHLIRQSIKRIVLKTQVVQSDYTFNDFKSLIVEIENFVRKSPGKESVDLRQWTPLFEQAKIHLFGPDAEMNSVVKWKESIDILLDIHLVYLNFQYRFSKTNFYSNDSIRALDETFQIVISILERARPLDKDGIQFSDTAALITSLKKVNAFPAHLSAEAVFEAYKTLVKTVLSRANPEGLREVSAFNKAQLLALKAEYKSWKIIQDFNNKLALPMSYSDFLLALKQAPSVSEKPFPEVSNRYMELSWKQWQSHLDQKNPVQYLESGEVVIDRLTKDSTKVTWSSLTRLNFMRVLTRVFVLGYGQKKAFDLSKDYLLESDVFNWYKDFWLLGTELQAFDKRTGNAGKRTFFEADHFLSSSNGDGKVDLQEAFELVNTIFATGLTGVSKIQKDFDVGPCALSEKDDFDHPWLNEDCVRVEMRLKFAQYFKNMPAFTKWVGELSGDQWNEFFTEWVSFSRVNESEKGRIETGDLRTMVVILHYIENMYVHMDLDQDDQVSLDELEGGSERFALFFKELYGMKPKSVLNPVYDFAVKKGFACLVLSGEMPSVWSCGIKNLKNGSGFTPYSNRYLILKTLNSLKSSIK